MPHTPAPHQVPVTSPFSFVRCPFVPNYVMHFRNFCKKPEPNKKQKIQDSSGEDEAQYFIVCLESYSRSKEIWLQCCSCKAWAHKDCTDGSDFYTCHNCESDEFHLVFCVKFCS
ncbi:hypothetical protein NQZ68_037240 [Dissostichus eleginoides]|nr:hypothetical protein NQZ68_037240 [Dissostichus eleginoides]